MELSINGVSKKYKDKLAVNALSLELHGGIYGLLGPKRFGQDNAHAHAHHRLKPDRRQHHP